MDERLQSERLFHDQQAAIRRQAWADDPSRLQFPPEDYLDHEPWVRFAVSELGPLAGKAVLDFGCGHGMASVMLAQQGASVTAFDLSGGYVQETRQRARANGVRVQAVIADGHRLPFADRVFDAVWGVAILHHLDMALSAREIRRVLKREGVAVFCEPWGGNPALTFARKWLPYRGKERTRDEKPLSRRALNVFEKSFSISQRKHVQLLGMIRRAWPGFPMLSRLDSLDSTLMKRFPRLGQWSRYVVLTVRP